MSDIKQKIDDHIQNQGYINPSQLQKDGWAYHDLPRMDISYFTIIVNAVKLEEIKFLSFAVYGEGKTAEYRGQILISPKGRENLQEYRKLEPVFGMPVQ